MDNWQELAEVLVEEFVAPQGVDDKRILEAMKAVPRHFFVPEQYQEDSYVDTPISIGEEQTISQPFIVAKMTDLLALNEGDNVLEIGTGSGYQAALLAEMGMKVTTIERIETLAHRARMVFQQLPYDIRSIIGDGREGYPESAPYQGIIVTAGAQIIEESWLSQLAAEGRLVLPLASKEGRYCLLVRQKTKSENAGYKDTWYDYCRFVPLLAGIKSNRQNTSQNEKFS